MATRPNPKCPTKRAAVNSIEKGENKKPARNIKMEGNCNETTATNVSLGSDNQRKKDVVFDGINLLASDLAEYVFPSNQQHYVENCGKLPFTSNVVLNEAVKNNLQKGNQAPLFSESTYYLNKSRTKWISVGMSANLHFDPVIRLMGKGQCITFTEDEWKNVINSRQLIMNSFVGDLSTPPHFVVSGVTCSSQWIENVRKVLKMERGSEIFYLAYDSLHELWKLSDLVSSRVEVLNCMEYKNYYDSVIDVVSTMQGDIKSNILVASNGVPSEHLCVTKELLVYGMDKVLLDLDLHALMKM
ncbi:uncharacterized protein [Onthophagus taurus]|uniref:uncharacterized protein n=1 Tax=Onthophagus taurus TaxID=166361 RepID=UPI0039BE0BB4